jgi:hypothetical protein
MRKHFAAPSSEFFTPLRAHLCGDGQYNRLRTKYLRISFFRGKLFEQQAVATFRNSALFSRKNICVYFEIRACEIEILSFLFANHLDGSYAAILREFSAFSMTRLRLSSDRCSEGVDFARYPLF